MAFNNTISTKLPEELNEKQNSLIIFPYLEREASDLAKRNELVMGTDSARADAEQELAQRTREKDIVTFVRKQAEQQGIDVAEQLENMPPDFREMYEKAFEDIREFVDVIDKTDPSARKQLDIEMLISIYNTPQEGFTSIILPVHEGEKQQQILPGALYGATLIAGTKAAKTLGAKLIPANDRGLSTLRIDHGSTPGRHVQKALFAQLAEADYSDLEKAGVNLSANLVDMRHTVKPLYTIRGTSLEEKTSDAPQSQNESVYTLKEAAQEWKRHEEDLGTVNGDESNYLMKTGRRAKEGRLKTETNGTVTKSNLDDFLVYTDMSKELKRRRDDGDRTVSIDDCAELMRVQRPQIVRYIRNNRLQDGKDDDVTINSLKQFTSANMYRTGKWAKFKNKSKMPVARNLIEITKDRDEYMTAKEAEAHYGETYFKIIGMAKKGELTRYKSGNKVPHLFDIAELDEKLR